MSKWDAYQVNIDLAEKKLQTSLVRAIEASGRVLTEGMQVAFREYQNEMKQALEKYQGPNSQP